VAPSQVPVRVENGTGTGGLAGRVSSELSAGGFRVGTPGNADNHDYAQTEIRYAPALASAAQTVRAALPGATMHPDPAAGDTVVVILGRSFTAVQPVTVATPGAKPSVPTTTAADNPCAKS
jgi:hypothetical protein